MPKNAKVFSLFLAGAGDVLDEQQVIRQIVEEWNMHHGIPAGALLNVTSWRTNVYPIAGSSPQNIINSRLVDEADIVVGVFWTRFGTPTEVADSGTQEEIERSISAKKRVMVYFSNCPVAPDSLDTEQHSKVQAFKKQYANQGLYHNFDHIDEFRTNFRGHLAGVMSDVLKSQDGDKEGDGRNYDPDDPGPTFSIEFSSTYWTIILAALEHTAMQAGRKIQDMGKLGYVPEDVSDADRTVLAAPIIIRSVIVDELVKHGIMKRGVAEKAGYSAMMKMALEVMQRYKEQKLRDGTISLNRES
jgi:hypothetical protein